MSAAAVGILGAGRQAHETAGYYLALGAEVRFFAANEEFYEAAKADPDLGAEVLEMERAHEEHPNLTVITAIGYASLRRRFVAAWPGARWDVLVAERAWVAPDAELGEGTQIAPGGIVNRWARVGRHVLVNIGATVVHESVTPNGDTAGSYLCTRLSGEKLQGAGGQTPSAPPMAYRRSFTTAAARENLTLIGRLVVQFPTPPMVGRVAALLKVPIVVNAWLRPTLIAAVFGCTARDVMRAKFALTVLLELSVNTHGLAAQPAASTVPPANQRGIPSSTSSSARVLSTSVC